MFEYAELSCGSSVSTDFVPLWGTYWTLGHVRLEELRVERTESRFQTLMPTDSETREVEEIHEKRKERLLQEARC